jgi:hypothetical protein
MRIRTAAAAAAALVAGLLFAATPAPPAHAGTGCATHKDYKHVHRGMYKRQVNHILNSHGISTGNEVYYEYCPDPGHTWVIVKYRHRAAGGLAVVSKRLGHSVGRQ